ncbi:hypothetical protein C2857_000695 [Epichloe festucae Fl1]|uniref:Zinc finger C3HC4 RING-type domain-containing protein n=1 Tax=Epichloe festucae (strain Fl1) TaxID=877507 RepID=A0A7S9KU20_EPIFF|nr:hypothetical protein C2857_000695 [Epichloe festucae Fl1]
MESLTRIITNIRNDLVLASKIAIAVAVAILVAVLILFTGFALYRRLERRRRKQRLWKQPETRPVHQLIARRRLRPFVRRIAIDTTVGWYSAHARSEGQIDKGHCPLCDKPLVTELQVEKKASNNYLRTFFKKLISGQVFPVALRSNNVSLLLKNSETRSRQRTCSRTQASTASSEEEERQAIADLKSVRFASEVSQLLGCGHMFHSPCLVNWWLEKRGYCQVCGFEY